LKNHSSSRVSQLFSETQAGRASGIYRDLAQVAAAVWSPCISPISCMYHSLWLRNRTRTRIAQDLHEGSVLLYAHFLIH